MNRLTNRESQLLELISSALLAQGKSPSYRDLLKLLGLSSPGTIYKQIQKLKAKGFIKSDETGKIVYAAGRPHDVAGKDFVHVPLIGSIAKGENLELFAKMSLYTLPSDLIGQERSCYGFLIRDQSFAEAHLQQGDLLIVDTDEAAKPGDRLLVATDEGTKILHFEEYDEEFDGQIRGILVAAFRSYFSGKTGY